MFRSLKLVLPLFLVFLFFYPAAAPASDIDEIFKILSAPRKTEPASPPPRQTPAPQPQPKQQQVPKQQPQAQPPKTDGLQNLFKLFEPAKAQPSQSNQPVKGGLSKALQGIDLAKEIENKTIALERQLQKVFFKIRAYQAMNGAIWVTLGKSYSSLVSDLNILKKSGSNCVQEFVTHTRRKRNQQMELVGQVTLDTSGGLGASAEIISMNQKKNQNLREAVKQFIQSNPVVGIAFQKTIDQQNIALDVFLETYMGRLSEVTRYQFMAAEIFANMSKEFKAAELEMRRAIDTFNQESGLVSLKAAEHLDNLYAQVRDLRTVSKSSSNDLITTLTILPKIPHLLKEVKHFSDVLSRFNQVRDYLAKQSVEIKAVCDASGTEIAKSSQDVGVIGLTLQEMWNGQVSDIRRMAAKRRLSVKDLSRILKKENDKNRLLAAKQSRVQETKMKEMASNAFGGPLFD